MLGRARTALGTEVLPILLALVTIESSTTLAAHVVARENRFVAVPPISLRLPKGTADKVRVIAILEHRSLADTVRELAEEAIKMREFPDIVVVNGPTGRRARFIHGPDVWEVIEPYVLGGKEWVVLRDSYPDFDEALLRSAVRYYESYPDEIEARIALNLAT